MVINGRADKEDVIFQEPRIEVVGSFAAGGLLLAARQQTARIALILMILVVVGRIGWLMANLFPIGTSTQVMDIAANTVLALGFTIILAVKLPSISE